jgi:HlyD family secretion protein
MSVKKIVIAVVVLIVAAAAIVGTVKYRQSKITAVTTALATRQELVSVVSGTGQIKPKTYVNVGATAFGRITHLNVKEGDHVKAGTVLATVENVEPEATVAAQQAAIAASRTDVNSMLAAEKTADANVAQAKADLEQKKLDFDRAQALYNDKLIAKQDFDAKKAAYDMSYATLNQRQASLVQAQAQTASQRSKTAQAVASQRSNYDALDKTVSRAPFDGLVTNVPVREGETVVVGIQNAEGSTLMTLADMSVITADVTVDALPGRIFKGHVTEVGDQALLRTTGIATSQSTTGTEEAKDFKVVVTLDHPSDELRPGLSATAKITTARKPDALTIPIQSLVERDPAEERQLSAMGGKRPTDGVAASTASKAKIVQGVYVIRHEDDQMRVEFVPVSTGITGTTDIEVLSGLKAGDEIVTGRYKVLRTLTSGTVVKQDTTPDKVDVTS